MEETKAEGLKWIKRGNKKTPYWVADEEVVKAGYTPKTLNLNMYRDQPEILVAKCEVLQAEMKLWRAGYRRNALEFDGTFRSLFTMYQKHPESEYHSLKPSSKVPYDHYLPRMESHIGARRVDAVSGLDIKQWHRTWSSKGEHLAASHMCRAILRAVVSFGIQAKAEGCIDFMAILLETNKDIPSIRPRTAVLTADQVVAARKAAHKRGRPSAALAYAIVYESLLRLWDVIGQWVPINAEGISDIVNEKREEKWIGLRWEDIDSDMILTYTPSKTEDTTGKKIKYPLFNAPMVLEELEHWPMEKRVGPVIVNEQTMLPWREGTFRDGWRKDRITAGIPKDIWARDLRASGVTEGRAKDASADDVAKVAGHSKRMTENVYDRAVIEAATRFSEKRTAGRSGNDNK